MGRSLVGHGQISKQWFMSVMECMFLALIEGFRIPEEVVLGTELNCVLPSIHV